MQPPYDFENVQTGYEFIQRKPVVPRYEPAQKTKKIFLMQVTKVLIELLSKKKVRIGSVVFSIGLLLFLFLGSNWVAITFALIGIFMFLPMAMFKIIGMEFNFAAMIMLASMQSFEVGFIVGKLANLIGHLVTFDLEPELFYEFIVYIPIAFVASLFPFSAIIWVGVILTLLYNTGYLLYHKFTGLLTGQKFMYSVTNCMFNVIIFLKIVPMLQSWGWSS